MARRPRPRVSKPITFTHRPAPRAMTRMTDYEWVESGATVSMESSDVAAIQYDKKTGNLKVHFRRGAVYVYKLVPEKVARMMFNASTTGTFTHRYLNKRYPYKQVTR